MILSITVRFGMYLACQPKTGFEYIAKPRDSGHRDRVSMHTFQGNFSQQFGDTKVATSKVVTTIAPLSTVDSNMEILY